MGTLVTAAYVLFAITGGLVWLIIGILVVVDVVDLLRYGRCRACRKIMRNGRSENDRKICKSCAANKARGILMVSTPSAWEVI